MGSSKDHFLDFRALLPGSQKYFCEYLCENENIFENILGYCPRAQVLSIYAKTRVQKSHATVPLKGQAHEFYFVFLHVHDKVCRTG